MTPITFTIDETFVVAKDTKKGWIFDGNPNLDYEILNCHLFGEKI